MCWFCISDMCAVLYAREVYIMSIVALQKARAATSEEERAKRDLAEAEAKLKTLEEAAKAVRISEAYWLR